MQAASLFMLGSIYYEAGEVRQAVEAFEQCLVLRRKIRFSSKLWFANSTEVLTSCAVIKQVLLRH